MPYQTIKFESKGPIGILSLNRADRLNAITVDMLSELLDLLASLDKYLKTRVVVLRGEGRVFCAGADLSLVDPAWGRDDDLGRIQFLYENLNKPVSNVVLAMRRIPQPLVAAVRGPATGGGFSLALACDIRIAGQSARFNAAFVRVGSSGGDMGSSYFLPRLVGFSRAAEYLYTGRFMDAVTAERLGVVSRVVPDEEVDAAAIVLAEEMLLTSPFGLRMTKELLNINSDAPSLESAVHLENRTQLLCLQTEDAQEGPRAFFEKRPPVWRDR